MVGIQHWPKKGTEHTEPGGALALAHREEIQLASEPRGAGSDQAEGDATWPKITAASGNAAGPAACVWCSGGKWRTGVLTLVSELESQRGKVLLPTKSLLRDLDCQD